MDESLTVSEAAAAAGVSAHTLRYYERAGLLDQVEEGLDGQQAEIDAGLEALESEEEKLEQGEAMLEMAAGIGTVSEDETTALVMVSFTEAQEEVSQETRDAVISVFADNPVPGTTVDFADDIAFPRPSDVLRYRAIDRDEYDRTRAEVEAGRFRYRIREAELVPAELLADPDAVNSRLLEVLYR